MFYYLTELPTFFFLFSQFDDLIWDLCKNEDSSTTCNLFIFSLISFHCHLTSFFWEASFQFRFRKGLVLKSLIHGLVHLVLSPEMVPHQLFSNKGFVADWTHTRTIFLKMDCRKMSLSIPQPRKGPTAQTALASTIVEFNDPSLWDLPCKTRKETITSFESPCI